MAWIALADVAVALGGRDVVSAVTASVSGGELIVIVGPNGAGKTTLLRAIAGLLKPRAGRIEVMGHDPASAARRVIARELAYLPQQYELAFPFAVEEVVLFGRYGTQRGVGLASDADLAAARAAMEACDVGALAERRFDQLSGGEARRVIIAQALCQGAKCLLLDEPTAGLDPAHARAVFAMLAAQCRAGAAAIVVTHDLDLALRYGHVMWLVAGGGLAARGTPAEVLDATATREAFGVRIHVGALPDGTPFAVPA
ncbi:MAG TPA: ABC transporter ATP-binding protein [Kofleriaceae bacterium]|jgi:iron complex transport system ATP-binding protein|nr:ABC transporter ATP-binding protein [Kofleriaceae bacterium]